MYGTPDKSDDSFVRCELHLTQPSPETLQLQLHGSWTLYAKLPSADLVQQQLVAHPHIQTVTFQTQDLSDWDSGLLTFLRQVRQVIEQAQPHEITIDQTGLPDGVQRLLRLTAAVPERQGVRRETARLPLLARIGTGALHIAQEAGVMLRFVGEVFRAFLKLLRGKARFRRSDLIRTIQDCGPRALPIVSLISFLVGLILAFVGAVQLRPFGAQIYVADMVGLGMVREMGAMMTGIIMAGRTGAAFAAQLGAMTVNEEIDALTTMGISSMEFLVLPRMLALVVMLPLLAIYADLMGILGGAVIGVAMLGLEAAEYMNETRAALTVMDFGLGLLKAAVFGVMVALAGCLRGMQCGRSASAVGEAATSAVVTAIVLIVVSSSVLTVIYDVLGV